MRLLLAAGLVALMFGLRLLLPDLEPEVSVRAPLVFGFLLLAGYLLGECLVPLSLPRISGYLLSGMVFGPDLMGLADREVIEHLAPVDELALCLIALTAGGELRIDRVRRRLRSILVITFVQTGIVFLAVAGVIFAIRGAFPYLAPLGTGQALAVAALLALVATAKSPATTVAVIVETRARGAFTDTVLGVTMLKDIVVLVAASVVLSLSAASFGAGPGGEGSVALVLGEVGLSFIVGAGAGGLAILYLRYVRRERVVFVLTSAFLIISLCKAFHLHTLLVAMFAGFTVCNASGQGSRFLSGLERASGPVFVIFFCLAGAALNLRVLLPQWHLVLLFVVLRLVTMWAGTGAGAILARDDASIRRHAWTGFLGQAGVSLGIAALARQALGGVGDPVADLIVGGVVLNQIIGPVLFRRAIVLVGDGRKA